MRKEHAMAIFIGVIMISSVAGFAISGVQFQSAPDSGQVKVPDVIDRQMTREEFRAALLSGKTIIQNHYPLACTDCGAVNDALAGFVSGMEGFVVLERFGVQFENETMLQLVGSDGRITELSKANITEDFLLDTVCSSAYVLPKKCVMRGIG